MNPENLIDLLESYRRGELSTSAVLAQLRRAPYEAVENFALLDHHRALRSGFPEVIFCPGKTPAQITALFRRLSTENDCVLATRLQPEIYTQIQPDLPEATYDPVARALYVDRSARARVSGVIVLTAGTADVPVAEEAALTATLMGCAVERVYDVGVAGLHRLLNHLPDLQVARVLIVVAGMEGALPSVVGGLVACPVIAVPTSVGYGANFAGLSALLAMLNSCASGVAVVNIDNGFGAGVLAAKINRVTA